MKKKKSLLSEEKIIKYVSEFYGQDVMKNTDSRKRQYYVPRQVLAHFLREYMKYSFQKIGSMFGKDHATALHMIKTLNEAIEYDRYLRSDVEVLTKKIKEEEENEFIINGLSRDAMVEIITKIAQNCDVETLNKLYLTLKIKI